MNGHGAQCVSLSDSNVDEGLDLPKPGISDLSAGTGEHGLDKGNGEQLANNEDDVDAGEEGIQKQRPQEEATHGDAPSVIPDEEGQKKLLELIAGPDGQLGFGENVHPGLPPFGNDVIGQPSGLEGAPGLSTGGSDNAELVNIDGNFNPDNFESRPPLQIPEKVVGVVDENYQNANICVGDIAEGPPSTQINTWLNTHHRGSCLVATFSNDGYLLASGSRDASIKIVDVGVISRASGSLELKPVTRTFQHHSEQINDIKFHPAGCVIVSASDDGTIKYFDVAKTSLRRSFKSTQVGAPVKSLSFHPSGDYFLMGASSRRILLYDTHTFKSYSPIGMSCTTGYPCVRFAPTASHYATADGSPSLSIYDIVSSRCVMSISARDMPTYQETPLYPSIKLVDLCWNSEGTQIAICYQDGYISSYDIRTGNLLCKYRDGLSKIINPSVSYGPGDKYLFGIDSNARGVIVWETSTQKVHARIPAHSRPVLCAVASPTTHSFASCSEDFKAKYWAPVE